jgi:DNA modification methylase
VRNIILRYSRQNETVLDPMCGSGTTLIETKLLSRRGVGLDISERAVETARSRLDFSPPVAPSAVVQEVRLGDARDLSFLADGSVSLCALHPPYSDIIRYAPGVEGDLSSLHEVGAFLDEMEKVGREVFRVLRGGGTCCLLIGDTRRRGLYVPLAMRLLMRFLPLGFEMREEVIKVQWNCGATEKWRQRAKDCGFLLIAHEHLFVLRKPMEVEKSPLLALEMSAQSSRN